MSHVHEHRIPEEATALEESHASKPVAARKPGRQQPRKPLPRSQESGQPQPQPQPQPLSGVDPRIREAALKRLKRIEGQVRGLHRMVEEGRYCADILMQIASAHEALRGVGRLLMRNHLEHCVTDALRSGDGLAAERAYEEVLDLMYKHAR